MNTKEQLVTMLLEGMGVNIDSIIPIVRQSGSRHLKFTDKEIMKMPKKFRHAFRLNNNWIHYRKRTSGRYRCSYEIRYAKKPFDKRPITASGNTIEQAKKRFIEKLNRFALEEENVSSPIVPKDFQGFAMYWFENFHKRKVAENTYAEAIRLYNRHVKEYFGYVLIEKISPVMLQSFLDQFDDRAKTKDDLYSMLNQILTASVKHGLLSLNPLGMVFHKQHEKEHGKAISKADEKKLLDAYTGTPYQVSFAIVLYTGLRPNEYATATIDGKFIKAVNSKRKGKKKAFKRIPITSMLRPYLNGISEIKMPTTFQMTYRIKKVLPNHSLYDMRTTFQTRCTECGISEVAIGLFMGNGIGGTLKEAYTDVSDEWLLKEGEKLNY